MESLDFLLPNIKELKVSEETKTKSFKILLLLCSVSATKE